MPRPNDMRLAMITENEGFRPTVYKDTVGKRTVGLGFNVDDPSVAKHIDPAILSGRRQMTLEEAQTIFNTRFLPTAEENARQFVGEDLYKRLAPEQQAALVDMAYNLGLPRLSKFQQLRAALQNNNFDAAGQEIMNSLYAKQVPNRARRNALLVKGPKK